MREHLVGYLLGVLDDAERDQVRDHLERDPQLVRDLERIQAELAPLEQARKDWDPPPGLADRTCDRVAQLRHPVMPARGRAAAAMQPEPTRSRVTAADAVVVAGVVLAASILFFPAILNSRYQARVAACQNNLRQLGVGLRLYSLETAGCFPFVPAEGNRAVAGIYAPILIESGCLDEPRSLLCPSSPLAEQREEYQVPSLKQIDLARGEQLRRLWQIVGGSYGYCLGYQDDGVVRPVRDRGRDHFVLASDMPQLLPCGANSRNHGGRGQNVLFESGRVGYLLSCLEETSRDNFFLSDRGRVEAGLHQDDSVVANSAAPPIPWMAAPAMDFGEASAKP
jgi:hypothetical protein